MFDNRKLLSTVLAASMASMLVPAAAVADDVYDGDDAAGIELLADEVTQVSAEADLVTAINNDSANTIQLTADITLTEALSDITREVTLDLNDHTLSMSNGVVLNVNNNGKLTVKNGTISSKYNTLSGNAVICVSAGTVKVENSATIEASNCYGITVFNTATLAVYGTVTSDYSSAIAGNGSDHTNGTTITIENGAKITSKNDVAIYHPQPGTMKINGGIITGGLTGIEAKAGHIDVYGGVINGGNVEQTKDYTQANGTSSKGYSIVAIDMENQGYLSPAIIHLYGGKYNIKPEASNADYIPGGYTINRHADNIYVIEKTGSNTDDDTTDIVAGTDVTYDDDGSKIETTKNTDGKITEVKTTKTDGTVVDTTYTYNDDGSYTTTTTTSENGITMVSTVDANGNTTKVDVNIPSDAVKDGKVTLPAAINPTNGSNKDSAPVVTITSPANTQVTIPVGTDSNTIVAVDKATGDIIKVSPSAENAVVVTTDKDGNAQVTIINNAKSFTDVSDSDWFADYVARAAAKEIMNGIGEDYTRFAPNDFTNRAMMAQIVYNMANAHTNFNTSTYNDVLIDYWYTNAIWWADSAGVINGYTTGADYVRTGYYGPEDFVTREQAITMLWRYAGKPDADTSVLSRFADGDNHYEYSKTALAWAVEVGILEGRNGTSLAAGELATRAEIATMVVRFSDL